MATQERFLKEIPKRYANATLSKVDFGIDQQRDIMTWIKDPINFLVFMGSPGCGKTYASIAIAKALHEKTSYLNIEYVSMREFFTYLKSLYAQNESDEHPKSILNKCDILILDDIGASKNSSWEQEILLDIIDYRYANLKPAIISTNLNFKAMAEEKFDIRTISRLKATENLVVQEWDIDRRMDNV